jgi:hypothetical protein
MSSRMHKDGIGALAREGILLASISLVQIVLN